MAEQYPGNWVWDGNRVRSRVDFSTSQELGTGAKYGSFYVNLSQQSYWGMNGYTRSLSAGYGNKFGPVNYNFSVSQNKDTRATTSNLATGSTQVQLNLSFPLGSGRRAPRYSNTTSYSQTSGTRTQNSLYGELNEKTYYSINAGYASQSRESNFGMGINTATSVGGLSANYNYSKNYQSVSANMSGALVLHRGGMNMSPSVGDGFAILESQGVKDTKLAVQGGGSFGFNGYAIMPNLAPYRVNAIALDTRELSSGVELEETVHQVVPRRGAIVKASYKGYMGRRMQFRLLQEDGQILPFATSVKDEEGQSLGFVDPNGRALVLLKTDRGRLYASWSGKQCVADFTLPAPDKELHYQKMDLVCRAKQTEGDKVE